MTRADFPWALTLALIAVLLFLSLGLQLMGFSMAEHITDEQLADLIFMFEDPAWYRANGHFAATILALRELQERRTAEVKTGLSVMAAQAALLAAEEEESRAAIADFNDKLARRIDDA